MTDTSWFVFAAKQDAEVTPVAEPVAETTAAPASPTEEKAKKEKAHKGPGFLDKIKGVLSPKKSPKPSPTEEVTASPLETATAPAAATEEVPKIEETPAAAPAAEAAPVEVSDLGMKTVSNR